MLMACARDEAPNPWGLQGEGSDEGVLARQGDEMIVVTSTGADTYYEYHGKPLGLHYLLLERYCKQNGMAIRVDLCRDEEEMVRRVAQGEADVYADGTYWIVRRGSALKSELAQWVSPTLVQAVADEEERWLSPASITRHVYSPMKNRARGIISDYDHLFQRYATTAGCDWRLLAAQCYQESTFDPRARSRAGACGLMQIMPSTADHLGLARADIYDPERNIAAAARYMAELQRTFSDITNKAERQKFALAAYNGGAHHIRDAMTLTRKHGGNAQRWDDVKRYVLALAQKEYYNDPDVRYGYMRGAETADYVDKIIARWSSYR